jgi:ribosomal protein S18 acetylase RimI-like enzyme
MEPARDRRVTSIPPECLWFHSHSGGIELFSRLAPSALEFVRHMASDDQRGNENAPLNVWESPDGLRFETLENPPLDLLRAVGKGLDEYNRAHIGDYTYSRLGVFAYDPADQQTLIGGVFGDLLWDWLHIDSLWVREEYRGRGVGSELMRRAEEIARSQGTVNIHLETTSFQALLFYQKLGFEVFGELPGKPVGVSWHYLKKQGVPLTSPES